jgi:hypothetical protein
MEAILVNEQGQMITTIDLDFIPTIGDTLNVDHKNNINNMDANEFQIEYIRHNIYNNKHNTITLIVKSIGKNILLEG